MEFVPDRPPQTLEQYCEENGVDIRRVVASETESVNR